jgi:hypothetical protein
VGSNGYIDGGSSVESARHKSVNVWIWDYYYTLGAYSPGGAHYYSICIPRGMHHHLMVLPLVLWEMLATELAWHYATFASSGLVLRRILIHDHLATAEAAGEDALGTE